MGARKPKLLISSFRQWTYACIKNCSPLQLWYFYISTKIPPGHPEGIFDSMGNIYNGVAKAIKKQKFDSVEFPSIDEGVRGMDFIEKAVKSHQSGNIWMNLD